MSATPTHPEVREPTQRGGAVHVSPALILGALFLTAVNLRGITRTAGLTRHIGAIEQGFDPLQFLGMVRDLNTVLLSRPTAE